MKKLLENGKKLIINNDLNIQRNTAYVLLYVIQDLKKL